MLSFLKQRLAVFTVSDATPDGGYDNATYTFSTYAWGRIEPRGNAEDRTVAGAAIPHRTAMITFRDAVAVPDFALVYDPVTGDQWRITGTMRRRIGRMTQYTADYAPQFARTATAFGP